MAINSPSTDNSNLQQIAANKLVSQDKLIFLLFLQKYGPATVNEIIAKIENYNPDLEASRLRGFNRLTKPLTNVGLIEVFGNKKVKRKNEKIIKYSGNLPSKFAARNSKISSLGESALSCVILAVEFYNKPITKFRSEVYLTLMCVGWTKLIQALIHKQDGAVYFERDKQNKFLTIDGIKKTWSLEKCVDYYFLDCPTKENIKFLIQVRNRFVHQAAKFDETVDAMIFGECQAMLFNFELIFKKEFTHLRDDNLKLDLALQFSQRTTKEQWGSIKDGLKNDAKTFSGFVQKYRSTLKDETFKSPDFTFRVMLIPVIANSGKNADFAVEYVKDPHDIDKLRESVDKLNVVVKEKIVNVSNESSLLPMEIVDAVKKVEPLFTMHYNTGLAYVLNVRPNEKGKPYQVNNKYCIYDKSFKRYLYTHAWSNLLQKAFKGKVFTLEEIKLKIRNKEKININEFEKKISALSV